MIVTFCGHSRFYKNKDITDRLLSLMEEKIKNLPVDFYLGGYGDFDNFAYECCNQYKKKYPNAKLIFVTPYMTIDYQKNHLESLSEKYDEIIYPELEKVPYKFAISYRNKWMVDKADLVIAYVNHEWGGAYKTYKYAIKKGKQSFNLGAFDIEK